MTQKVFLVDAFMDGPYSGAPTAVVFLNEPVEKLKMSSLASELGCQETVFLLDTHGGFLLRFFSLVQEVPLSIHSCLAAAHLIYELATRPPDNPIKFHTQEGEISASLADDQKGINLIAASQLLAKLDQARLEQFRDILGLKPNDVAWAALTPQKVIVLCLESLELLKNARVKLDELINAPVQGLAITSASPQSDCDYFIRAFLPILGIPEEQVSGNIHRSLAPQWGRLLQKKSLVCRQLSRRGGRVNLDLVNPNQVAFSGRTKTVLKAIILSDDYMD
ncbi:MAG: PhzF family phenazine biosynthesis protein [Deltaproteobacteria bacterium]|jgi:PhzF family phenazine biosynthesis protein|nr:PhzF family phenazine biosynthesis protein [Deltaproteobacteria bacterium]